MSASTIDNDEDIWHMKNHAVRVVHPAPCYCGCYCSASCTCLPTCNCTMCPMLKEIGQELQPEQMERLAVCECDLCKKTNPGARDRFKK